ncbi:C-type lectin (CTL) or carbohydrate-recognition domain (CRD) [Mactra antiquata]
MNILIFFYIVVSGVSCGLITESNGTAGEDINALTLVDLGKETRKPLLTLIGLALKNLHPCEVWSPWTPCDANVRGYYGTRTRTRQCVDKSSSEINTYKNETDIGLCEGKCPPGSNITTHGFCLKLHLNKLYHNSAEAFCESEGSYLINIDSAEKHEDVKNMLSGFGLSIHIDGRRATSSSPWVYKYGSQQPFVTWASGEPDNGSSELCLIFYAVDNTWYDVSGTSSRPFVCESI